MYKPSDTLDNNLNTSILQIGGGESVRLDCHAEL